MRTIILSLSIFALLAACAKKQIPEGTVKGVSKFQLSGGAAVSQAGTDEYNPYVLQTGDNYLVLVFASNRACGNCSGHNLFIARSTVAYNNDAVFPAFENPTVMMVAGTPLNYISPIAFAPVLSGNDIRIYLTNAGNTIQQTGLLTPGSSYNTTLSAITNTAGATTATVLGAEFTGSTIYARQNGTVYSFAPNTSNTPVAMATGQNATSVASVDGAFTSRYDGFFSLIDGTIAGMSLYGMGGNVEKVNTAIAKARLSARYMSVMRGGGFNGGLMFISGIESGSTTQDLYVVDGMNVWQMWQALNPKPPGAPDGGSTPAATATADPVYSPVAGHYGMPISVTITSTTSSAVICYTTSGVDPVCDATPACTTGTTYVSGVSVSYTTTNFKARACKAGLTDSNVVSATHVSDATQPTLPGTQAANTISSSQIDLTWALSTDNATPQAQIVYEICQSTSVSGCTSFGTVSYTTAANTTSYSVTGLSASTQYYFRVRAKDLAGNASPHGTQTTATTSAAPTVNAPTFSPVAGLYNTTQNVTISTTTGSATICYTTDGNTPACDATPSCTTGSAYSGTVAIAATGQLRAIGCRNGYTSSSVTGGTYTIDTVAPVISGVLPATNDSPTNTQVSYTLSENCASGNIVWARTGGTADAAAPHTKALTGAELNSGAHNGITLTNNPTLVTGAIYSVSFNCTDAAGNAAATVTSTNVTHSAPIGPPRLMEPNGTVNAMVLSGNNLYFGGDFTYVGVGTGAGAVLDISSGAISSSVTTILNIAADVYTSAPDGSGGWIIGGTFTSIAGTSRNRLARINADGSLHSWNPNANGTVNSLVVSGTTVYVGGSFTNVGGQTRNRIAALDINTGNATAWDANSGNQINVLAISGTTLYAGGFFTTIGGQSRNRIAALDTSTGTATAWNPNANGSLNSIAVSGSTVYVGGSFTTIGGQTRSCIAALDASTGTATAWNPSANSNVNAIAINGSTVYAGGNFSLAGGQLRSGLVQLNTGSNSATGWNPNPNAGVSAIAISGSNVYVGGDFTTIGGQTRNRLAALSDTTGSATSWNPSPSGAIISTISLAGSNMFAGGTFTQIAGQLRNRLAAIDVTTGSVTTWNPNISSGGAVVYSIALFGSTVYAGGTFSTVGGQTRNNIVALDASSGSVNTWNPNSNLNVNSLAVSASGSIVYAGGTFTSIGGSSRNRIAALDATTGSATAWNPGADNNVLALAVSGSNIYAGGSFNVIGGQTRSYLGAINDTSGTATAWTPNANNPIRCLTVSGTTLYVGGGITMAAGFGRVGGAAFDTGTGNITSWSPATTGAFATIYSIAVSGSTTYVAGSFANAGGQSRNNIAALDATTGSASTWNPNADQLINSVIVSGTAAYAGGNYVNINGQRRSYLAGINLTTGAPY
ncbi:MAG: chitobiase/beta-hexosaminidase C-terminal domain-containing protein [Spirochaetes bacterium]|nr:chitobiase/beta-hexosaminidase C-terminal domain-containing protein [Spirochaetota bacterium]